MSISFIIWALIEKHENIDFVNHTTNQLNGVTGIISYELTWSLFRTTPCHRMAGNAVTISWETKDKLQT